MRAIVLLAVLLVPLAGADHVFSHRVYVVGRVLDSAGMPAPGLAVNLTFEGVQVGGRCFDAKPEVTGPRGDFEVCRHTHALPTDARVVVRVGNASRAVAIDPDLRHASANLQLDALAPARDITGEREFARAFRVTGRSFVLLAESENAEGVRVNATPLLANVTARLLDGGTVLAQGNATPNEHGLYTVDLDVAEVLEGAVVDVSNGREKAEATASTLYRRADLNLVRDMRLADGPGADAPGSQTPLATWLALAAILIGASGGRRRRG